MALVIGVPQYLGKNGPLGTPVAVTSPVAGGTALSAQVTLGAGHGIQEGNQVYLYGSTGGTGTWNTTFYAHFLSPNVISLWTTNAGSQSGSAGYTSTLTGVPTVTNAKIAVVNNAGVDAGWNTHEMPIVGKSVIKGDGSILQAQINFIDGTATLPFTPSFVECATLIGGTADDGTTTAETVLTVGVINVGTITNASFLANFAIVPSANKTVSVLFKAYR